MAAGLVGAVLLIQGFGAVIGAPGGAVGGVTFAASSSSVTSQATNAPVALSDTGSSSTPTATATTTPSHPAPSSGSTGASNTVTTTAASAKTTDASDGIDVHTQISTWTDPPVTPKCPAAISGTTAGAPSAVSVDDIPGTTTADINSFATEYNAIRVANCLTPIAFADIRYSTCLEQRLFWMADDPSSDPLSAWGHTGVAKRSDGVAIVGCDGDLAGGTGYTGASVAEAWWDSIDHRNSLYQPLTTGSLANVCIYFAMTHGGYNNPGPNEPYSFTRSAAYWSSC
ncbi:MAG TPA: hypothetical protein VHZ81_08110 [Galbitalea sp.]|nr:hypothetical protein [Galbitalea sp.]